MRVADAERILKDACIRDCVAEFFCIVLTIETLFERVSLKREVSGLPIPSHLASPRAVAFEE
jgi:hypothetical protein